MTVSATSSPMVGPGVGRVIVVGTPIGNLGDWSPRAQQVLAAVDLIACEDTRRTGSLLSKHGIANPGMVVINEHTEGRAVERILDALAAGDDVAVVTDAGMPTISDPGAVVVGAATDAGHEVVVVPGPTAASAALAIAGFLGSRWVFEGFLPRKGRDRTARLTALAREDRMIVLYEAPHRIERTLADLAETLDARRRCVIARELTKLHESAWRGTLAEAGGAVGEPRGEYVIVIDEALPPAPVDDATIVDAVQQALDQGMSTRDSVAQVAVALGVAKRRVYDLANSLR